MSEILCSQNDNTAKKRKTALYILLFGITMLAISYTAVPLYDLFCRVTGYGGTTSVAEEASGVILDQNIGVRFDSNTANGLGWNFKPVTKEVDLKIGEVITIEYEATNLSNEVSTGTATFNVSPEAAGYYFNKIECFCFTEQLLQPGETVRMPVNFFVDPEIVDDIDANWIKTITLSYTFFPKDDV